MKSFFFAEVNSLPVATCGANAEGLGWIQIGGVYTSPQYRSMGISGLLIRTLAGYAEQKGKNLTLFVKINNAPALRLYKNCGFTYYDDFKISYLEITRFSFII